MAFVHGTSSRLYMNSRHLSGKVSGFNTTFDANLAETTTLLAGGTQMIPGLQEGEISVEGRFDSQPGGGDTSLFDDFRNASMSDNGVLFTACPAGLTIGRPAFVLRGDAAGFEVESSVDDAVSISYEAQADNGVDWGVNLADGSAVTATANRTSVDNLALSSNGGVASLHVTAVSGTTPTMTVVVEHSVDDAVWATLATFTAATDETSEFVLVPQGTTVNRYVRVRHDLTGSGASPSFSYLVAFARR